MLSRILISEEFTLGTKKGKKANGKVKRKIEKKVTKKMSQNLQFQFCAFYHQCYISDEEWVQH